MKDIFTLFELLMGIFAAFKIIKTNNNHENEWYQSIFLKMNEKLFIVLTWIHILISIILSVALIQLITFHIFLTFQQITTYEWILTRKDKNNQNTTIHTKVIKQKQKIEKKNFQTKNNIPKNGMTLVKREHGDDCDNQPSIQQFFHILFYSFFSFFFQYFCFNHIKLFVCLFVFSIA